MSCFQNIELIKLLHLIKWIGSSIFPIIFFVNHLFLNTKGRIGEMNGSTFFAISSIEVNVFSKMTPFALYGEFTYAYVATAPNKIS